VTEGERPARSGQNSRAFYPPHWRALSQREWFEPMVVEYLSHLGADLLTTSGPCLARPSSKRQAIDDPLLAEATVAGSRRKDG
jgi:hypothetical protein